MPGLAADPERWDELSRRMQRRVFLRSEGNLIQVGAPQLVSGVLRERSAEVVARFNRFYAAVANAYYTHPALRAEHLVNPLLEPLLALETEPQTATPLSRLDAVLEPDGSIRVIEMNSVGVCLVHMRGLFYLIRELSRGGFEDDARRLDQLSRDMVADGFLRYATPRLVTAASRPVIGAVTPAGFYRAGQLLYRAAFERAGCDYVFGSPAELEVTASGVELRGRRVDILWADFLFYLGYQYARYKETKFPTKMPDFGQAPAQMAALLADPRFLEHLRTGRVVNISPARAYLALPKSLLSWIHRADRPIPEDDRAFLQRHVARTWSSLDRADGLVTLEQVAKDRGDYLVKPCQYGASHGVLLGRLAEPAEWRAKLVEIWDDQSWALQEFREPVKTTRGDWVSLGLSNFDGVLGGVYFRTSDSLLINARDSGFIPAVPA